MCTSTAKALPREPIIERLRNTFHPWPEVCKVTEASELHLNLNAFSSTTGIIGSLLLSLTGAAMLADPPSYSAKAHEPHDKDPKPQSEWQTPWQQRRRAAGVTLLNCLGLSDFGD